MIFRVREFRSTAELSNGRRPQIVRALDDLGHFGGYFKGVLLG